MYPRLALPRSLAHVTPAFLTQALSERWPGIVVSAATISDATEGTSSRARLTLAYESVPTGANPPRTMWLKSSFNELHDVILRFDPFRIEARFYQLPDVPVATPRCYFSEYDESGHCFLLLEDLSAQGVRFGHVSKAVTRDDAKRVLDQLARLHGGTRDREDAFRPDWLDTPLKGGYSEFFLGELMDRLPRLWKGRRGDLVPEVYRDIDRTRRLYATLQTENAAGPGVLLHGDCHAGNVYYGGPEGAGLLDWSLLRWGRWAYDVGYYLVSALTVEDRRAWERELLTHYIAAFAQAGGDRIDFDRAWRAYAVQPLYGFLTWMATYPEMQGEETCRAVVTRFATAASDLGKYVPEPT